MAEDNVYLSRHVVMRQKRIDITATATNNTENTSSTKIVTSSVNNEIMEGLIEVVNKLQEVFSKTSIGSLDSEIQLPQIVVIGAQSAGKSSVLENIVGRDFLPRGSGIVTRRPLILHLIPSAKDDRVRRQYNAPEDEDWAVFGHSPDVVYTDFEEVRKEIDRDTDEKAGTNKGIMDEPILLSIYSDRVVKLSLVDLPGLVKVPIGDQPANIEDQVRKMILKYIQNPNSMILAVTPANQDIATSEAIKMAKEVDRNGERTLAVLTKLDLMDRGTNAADALSCKTIMIELGIVGVVNRSQDDINKGVSIQDALANEKLFLETNYPAIAKQNGIPFLSTKLHNLLMRHICHCMPSLRERIGNKLNDCERELRTYGDKVVDPNTTFFRLVHLFANSYNMAIKQGIQSENFHGDIEDLIGGAKISLILHNKFHNKLQSMNPTRQLTNEMVYKAMLCASGLRPTLLVPEDCFERMIRKEIEKFRKPCLDCAKEVFEEMMAMVRSAVVQPDDFKRFPKMRAKVTHVIEDLLKDRYKRAIVLVEDQIDIHWSYINTKHADFKAEEKLLKLMQNDPAKAAAEYQTQPIVFQAPKTTPKGSTAKFDFEIDGKSTSDIEEDELETNDRGKVHCSSMSLSKQDKTNCRLIRSLIRNYFQIIRKTLQDVIPKSIVCAMVEFVQRNLSVKLMSEMYEQAAQNGFWLVEDETIASKRMMLEAQVETLEEALEIMNELDQFSN